MLAFLVLKPQSRSACSASSSASGRTTSEKPARRCRSLLVLTPLSFLGGSFYSIKVLPPIWQKIALLNPVVYLISSFRWSFFGVADVDVVLSMAMTTVFLAVCLAVVWWIFKTGYRLEAVGREAIKSDESTAIRGTLSI